MRKENTGYEDIQEYFGRNIAGHYGLRHQNDSSVICSDLFESKKDAEVARKRLVMAELDKYYPDWYINGERQNGETKEQTLERIKNANAAWWRDCSVEPEVEVGEKYAVFGQVGLYFIHGVNDNLKH